jgi:hypothetical protein
LSLIVARCSSCCLAPGCNDAPSAMQKPVGRFDESDVVVVVDDDLHAMGS